MPETETSETSGVDLDALVFDGVSFSVEGGRELLHSVTVSVAPGSVTVLAGPSGAGKSTLLRLGNRLEVPTAGSVRHRGEDIAGVDPRDLRRRIGMVFQRPVPFAGTVRDNLLVAEPGAGTDRMASMLDRVGLDATFLDRVADELSGGEAQRMCIARTLLTDPDVLLMDEPTSALDHDNRLGIEALARGLAAQGLGVVWVTHDLDQIERIADRVEVLIDGRNATDEEAASYLERGATDDRSVR